MINLKLVFTWWHKQTLGTLLKTLFSGKHVGSDELGNRYYTNKKDERWVVYKKEIEASKITSDWFLWMHHTVNKIPGEKLNQYLWQKKHLENKTGTKDSYKPNEILKKNKKFKKYETWKN
jgi:NADH dehydrogenase